MTSRFSHYPSKPKSKECSNGFVILCSAHDASTSFLHTFETTRKARKARGTPTDEEQNLLRAMLIFASAGLDSMVKQLVRDALPDVVDRHEGSHEMLRTFVTRRLRRNDEPDYELISELFTHETPRYRMIEELVYELTSSSLQSVDQLFRVASFFDIPSRSISADTDGLRRIFGTRNQIAHEMDVDFAQPNRNRRPRALKSTKEDTQAIFQISNKFLVEVDRKLR